MKRYTTRFYFKNGLIIEIHDWPIRSMWRYIRKTYGVKNVESWEVIKK